MKKLWSCNCFFLLVFTSFAQQSEPLVYSVVYEFVHVTDTTKPDMPLRTKMLLEVGKTFSNYCNYDLENKIKTTNNQNTIANKSMGNKVVMGGPIVLVTSPAMNAEHYLKLPLESKLLQIEPIASDLYCVESKLLPIKWQIKTETKKINNYLCQKALGSFGGRIYTAWFATSLPFNHGPWKLWGLPGLILEATDSANQVKFICNQVTKGDGTEEVNFLKNERLIKTTSAKLANAKANFNNDPSGFAKANINDKTVNEIPVFYQTSDGKFIQGEDAKKELKKINSTLINNPIELTKQ